MIVSIAKRWADPEVSSPSPFRTEVATLVNAVTWSLLDALASALAMGFPVTGWIACTESL